MVDKERAITSLEKQVLLQGSEPRKQSYSGKEMDDLSDAVKTKEEEIQILWNVIKEINKAKGNSVNIGQLQKLMIRCEANVLSNSQHETHPTLFTSPNPQHY